MSIQPAAEVGFSRVAESYERGRPDYPHAAVAWLAERLLLGEGKLVMDLGAGTGKLTRQLLPYRARVIAIEPLEAMSNQLRRAVPGVEVLAATADQIPLDSGSVDAATAGQAFHWFARPEALAEIHRVLRPRGWLGLIWNQRSPDQELWDEIDQLSVPYRPPDPGDSAWRDPLADSGMFGEIQSQSFSHRQVLTPELLADRVLSSSYLAILEPELREELLQRLLEIGRRHQAGPGQPVVLRYLADAYACCAC